MSDTITAAFYRGDKSFAVEPTAAQPPGPGEVAIRVAYCGICGTDMHVYHGNMDARVGLNRVIGHEMSGTVESIGDGVSGFANGDELNAFLGSGICQCEGFADGKMLLKASSVRVRAVDLAGNRGPWTEAVKPAPDPQGCTCASTPPEGTAGLAALFLGALMLLRRRR